MMTPSLRASSSRRRKISTHYQRFGWQSTLKKKLFSLTKKDFTIQTFRAGGKGGQNQDKRDTGVRITHPASGAVGEARDSRSQLQNRKSAFVRLAGSKKFKTWLKIETGQAVLQDVEIEKVVDELFGKENIKIERRVNGRWEEWND